MRKFMIFALLILAACAPIAPDVLDRPVGASLLADVPTTAQEQVQEPQASPVMIASATPAVINTPTVDVMGTVQAEGISAQKTHDASIIIIVQATAEAQNGINTQAAQEVIYAQQTAAQAPSATAAAKTAEANNANLRSTEVALVALHATQTAEYPQLLIAAADAEAQAANAPVRAWVQAWGPLLTLLVLAPILLAGAWAILAWVNAWPEEEPETFNELAEQNPADVVQTNVLSGSYLGAMQYEFSGDPSALERFWQKVAWGHSISYRNFTPKEKGFSRDEFNVLQNELVEFGLARPMNPNDPVRGLHLTEEGRQYAHKRAHASPTPAGFTPIRA